MPQVEMFSVVVVHRNNKAPFRKPVKSAFYTEDRNRKGVVIKSLPSAGRSVRKKVGCADIPTKEDQVSSKVRREHLWLPYWARVKNCELLLGVDAAL